MGDAEEAVFPEEADPSEAVAPEEAGKELMK